MDVIRHHQFIKVIGVTNISLHLANPYAEICKIVCKKNDQITALVRKIKLHWSRQNHFEVPGQILYFLLFLKATSDWFDKIRISQIWAVTVSQLIWHLNRVICISKLDQDQEIIDINLSKKEVDMTTIISQAILHWSKIKYFVRKLGSCQRRNHHRVFCFLR